MSKPAIVHIITRLDLGGAQKMCLSLVKEFQKNHPDFETYLISGPNGKLVKQAQSEIRNLTLLKSLKWEVSAKGAFGELKNFLNLIKLLKQIKTKHSHIIVHTHCIKAGTLGRWAALFAGIKIRIHTIHGFGFHPYQNKLLWLIYYGVEFCNSLITTKFICVSKQDKRHGSEIFPFFTKKSQIIRAATLLEKDRLLHLQRQSDNKVFIYGTTACFKSGKNLFDTLKAFNLIIKTKPHSRLEIIGDGKLRPEIEKWIRVHNLQEKVTLHGWIDKPTNIMQKWHSFVFTSLWEGLPCAIVEAQNLKLPILSYNVGGINDITKEVLLPPKSWFLLANSMLSTQANPHKTSLNADLEPFYCNYMAKLHWQVYSKKLPPFDN